MPAAPPHSNAPIRRLAAVVLGALAAAVCWAVAGCVQPAVDVRCAGPLLFAARYECPLGGLSNSSVQAELVRDLHTMRQLGCNAVWFDYLTPNDETVAATAATQANLRSFFGTKAPDAEASGGLPMHRASAAGDETLHASVELAVAPGRATASRPSQLLRVWSETGSPNPSPRHPELFVAFNNPVSPTSWDQHAWLLAYYQAIAAGHTGGVLLWRFRSWPGETNGVSDSHGQIDPQTAAGIRAVAKQATEWHQFVGGAETVNTEQATLDSSALCLAVLRRGDRRFVLVYNTNTTRFARGTLHLAPRLCDEPVLKAIAHSTGERHLPKPDGTTIALLLKPTAAELFEIH